jgi:hypothetical protein
VLVASYVDQHTACSSDELYGPSKIVKVASLSEGRRHIAVLIVVCRLSREVDEASVDAELLLNSCCMLLCCTSLVGILPQAPGSGLHGVGRSLTRVLVEWALSLEMQPVLVGLAIQPGSQTCRIESLHDCTRQATPGIGCPDD